MVRFAAAALKALIREAGRVNAGKVAKR